MNLVARKKNLPISKNPSVTAEVGIGPVGQGFGFQAVLHIALPGMDEADARALADAAHQVCPYSNATRGNIEVTLHIDTKQEKTPPG